MSRLSPVRTAHVSAVDVHLSRGGRPVLAGVDLTASAGDRLAVVGENGRGKTTLLQVLAGRLPVDRGGVHRSGSLGVADQQLPVDGTVGDLIDVELATVRAALRALDEAADALATGRPGSTDAYTAALATVDALDAWGADRRVEVSLAALGAVDDRSRALATLSVGQRHRVRLACLLGAGHDVLLLDEPTNHLDAAGLDHLTDRLLHHPGAVVLVSHDRALLADVATTVLDLDPTSDGRPRTYGGGYAGYVAGRRAERERWEALHLDQIGERRRLADDLSTAQNRLRDGWRPDKGTGKHTRATRAPALVRAVHRRQEQLAAHTVSVPRPPLRFAPPELPVRPGLLLRADAVTVDGRLPRPCDVALASGARLVVTGPNGAGKSTLLAVLGASLEPDTGAVTRGSGVRVGRLAQESDASGRSAIPAFGLVEDVKGLSVGTRRRLDLARVLADLPHVLLLDEPTNHLSAALVDELTEALETTAAAVVLATHDRRLLRDTAHWPRLELG
ncbi:ATP-binding cassette domain-containing protein [Pseudonocardia abyssalis]|uniref:ABC-F family ATP-binding cassette domain-containing protein n=1 Tax=Pseudonocardia abyssalis TaxID=2792008 RepID=A0ABS6V0A7_9PSEU|nr:ATP-binding cassette domain-containing protein [Pseudonocardia abyssalis]MBW0117372.1 ABC-F family ATP-binding cassette domain-containing protein [Pseudonocardia abyssalis]MBW0137925.1 ABC-F family ATP-binding cassette domain-containing protein [Pseudonocardia abyssalis]